MKPTSKPLPKKELPQPLKSPPIPKPNTTSTMPKLGNKNVNTMNSNIIPKTNISNNKIEKSEQEDNRNRAITQTVDVKEKKQVLKEEKKQQIKEEKKQVIKEEKKQVLKEEHKQVIKEEKKQLIKEEKKLKKQESSEIKDSDSYCLPEETKDALLQNIEEIKQSTSPGKRRSSMPVSGSKGIVDNCSYKTKPGCTVGKVTKENQDNFIFLPRFMNSNMKYLFAVADGHGMNGAIVSGFIKEYLPKNLEKYLMINVFFLLLFIYIMYFLYIMLLEDGIQVFLLNKWFPNNINKRNKFFTSN